MKIKGLVSTLICLAAFQVSLAYAGPGVQVGSGSGGEGSVTPVPISINFEGGGGAVGGQFQILYDSGNLTPNIASGCSSGNWTCSVQSPGVLQYVSNVVLAGLPTELIGTVNFDISGAAANTYPITVANELYGDASEGNVPPSGTSNGQIQVLGPAYTSAPAPGALDLGSVIQNATDLVTNVTITNTGAVGSTLTGTCSETSDPDGVFSVGGQTNFSVLQGAPGNVVTVTCDSAGSIATHSGTMECTHNGTNIASPAVYNLSCTITAGPQPAYASAPIAPNGPINMTATNAGDPITPVNVTITNSGDNGTTLSGTCSLSGDAAVSLVGGGAYSVPKGSSKLLTVSCDSTNPGTKNASLSCTHNGSNLASPVVYAVACDVGPLKPAIFGSNPVNGGTVSLGEVVQNAPAPTAGLTISNTAVAPAQDLELTTCSLTGAGAPPISVSPDLSNTSVAPGASTGVTFSCATDTVGNYSATYSCDYILDAAAVPAGIVGIGSASWPVTCDVRDAESAVVPTPPSGTQFTAEADPGGSAQFDVVFSETNDEGVDGEVTDCSLADGSNFAISSPTFPAAVPAGGSVTVSVVGTDPGGVDSISDTLNCTYSDSSNPEGADVSYPLLITFGGDATFLVSKTFTDGSPASVTVTISCDTGLPLQQSKVISAGNPVNFVVTSFESGAMNCSVTETSTNGYSATYNPSGDSQNDSTDGCHFFAIGGGDANACAISNEPAPVTINIHKEWLIDGNGGDEFVPSFELTLYCDSEIVDGTPDYPMLNGEASALSIPTGWYKEFGGIGDQSFAAQVIPDYPSSHCWVEESVDYSAVETQNGCGNITVSAGGSASCTITNTVFYEGIPTLSQWGLMILVLLTLGVGLVGVRRFS